MLPRIPSIRNIGQTNVAGEVESTDTACTGIEKEQDSSCHSVQQIHKGTVPLPSQIPSINPTGKQEKSSSIEETITADAKSDITTKEKASPQEILENQLAGVLNECTIKGFELSLKGVSVSPPDVIPGSIRAEIGCTTSYDNRENSAKALAMVYDVIAPVLKEFASTYNQAYQEGRGLSPETQEAFKKQIQDIVARNMPKNTPSMETMLSLKDGKPIFSLGPPHSNDPKMYEVEDEIKNAMKMFNTVGICIVVRSETTINESEDKEAILRVKAQRDAKAYEARRKGLEVKEK